MKIAMILPSLANKGPILVARDLCIEYKKMGHECSVFYFDNIVEMELPCSSKQISFWKPIDWDAFDIVHSHMYRSDAYVFVHKPVLKKCHTKFITTLHQHIAEQMLFDFPIVKAYFVIYTWLFFLRRFDVLVTLSEYHKAYYEKCGLHNVKVIYNGRDINCDADIEDCDRQSIMKMRQKYRIIGGVAYITKRKGYAQLIDALKKLPQYALILVGDGPYLNELQRLARQNGVDERCLWLGNRKEGERYMKYFDVYALCSYTEGYPLAFIEAAAAKLPVVCSDIPVFKSIIPEDCSCFFQLGNIDSLCDAFVCADKQSKVLSDKVYTYYLHYLVRGKMAQNYMALYNRLLNTEQVSF